MRIGFKAKRIIKAVALALAGVAAITAVAFGVKAIVDYTKNDLKEINPSFEVGSLGSDGKYVADEGSLYTKEAFACDGLQIKLDFDSQIDYQIFYYDNLDSFISSTTVFADSFDNHVEASHARIVIKPTNDEDNKISWSERISYPKQLTVKVNKNQEVKFVRFNGKYLEIVDSIDKMRYTNGIGLLFSDGVVSWYDFDYMACTSTTLLRVDGGEDVNFKTSLSDFEPQFSVYEFSDLPTNATLLTNMHKYYDKAATFHLNKNTKYILISLSVWDGNTFTDDQVNSLSFSFTLTKTK